MNTAQKYITAATVVLGTAMAFTNVANAQVRGNQPPSGNATGCSSGTCPGGSTPSHHHGAHGDRSLNFMAQGYSALAVSNAPTLMYQFNGRCFYSGVRSGSTVVGAMVGWSGVGVGGQIGNAHQGPEVGEVNCEPNAPRGHARRHSNKNPNSVKMIDRKNGAAVVRQAPAAPVAN